jgi:5-methylcytosine-specific restriction endonuclease McrA|tara:strand:+ start:186 stop:440 length:255 start_codon:yes stop_codon:yes gene_type:complete
MFSNKELTLDHVIPKSKGGKTEWTNIVTACKKCNNVKANHTNIKPYKTPIKPNFHQLYKSKNHVHIDHPVWYKYINIESEEKRA